MKYRLLVTILALSLFFTACSSPNAGATSTQEAIPPVIAENTIIAEGRLEPVRYAESFFTRSGVVSEVLAEEGQVVKKGELLIRLGGEADTQYAAAELELANTQKALNDFLNASEVDFAQVVIDLKQAKEDYKEAEQYYNYVKNSPKVPQSEVFLYSIPNGAGFDYRTRRTYRRGPAPEGWITQAQHDMDLKKAQVEKLQHTYERMQENGVDRDQLAVLEAQLMTAKAGMAAFEVIAPFDGVVAKMHAKEGSSINPTEAAVTVADFSSWLVETTDLTEIDVVSLEEDQPVLVKLDAIPDVELKGTILSIGHTFSENQGDVVYDVTILLQDTHPAMRWGMTASVTFEGSE